VGLEEDVRLGENCLKPSLVSYFGSSMLAGHTGYILFRRVTVAKKSKSNGTVTEPNGIHY
jgi:hypothetical protein